MAGSRCEFTGLALNVLGIDPHVVPRLCGTFPSLSRCAGSVDFEPLSERYWSSIAASAAAIGVGMLGVGVLVPILFLAVRCCWWCRGVAGHSAPSSWPFLLYVLLLLGVAGVAGVTILVANSTFDGGEGSLLTQYDFFSGNLSEVASTAARLIDDIDACIGHVDKMIAQDPCIWGQAPLRLARSELGAVRAGVRDSAAQLMSVNEQVQRLDLAGWVRRSDTVRYVALVIPTCLVGLAALLELTRAARRRRGRSAAATGCMSSGAFAIAILALPISAPVYVAMSLSAADFCDSPDGAADGVIAATSLPKAARDLIRFYLECESSSTSVQLAGYLRAAKQGFGIADASVAAWAALCPWTDDAAAVKAVLEDARPRFEDKLLPLAECTRLQPIYCNGVQNGVCGANGIGSGAQQLAVSQALSFVGLVLCLALSSCVSAELRRRQSRLLPTEEPLIAGATLQRDCAHRPVSTWPPPPTSHVSST